MKKLVYRILKLTRLLRLAKKILKHWREIFPQRWEWKFSQGGTERTGSIVGPDGFYVRSHFRIEEYSIFRIKPVLYTSTF